MKVPLAAVAFALAFSFVTTTQAYVLEGESWTRDRTVHMQLTLNPGYNPTGADSLTTFNDSAQDALNTWNQYLAHVQFLPIVNSAVVAADSDDEMSAFFSDTEFGQSFGSGTLAITLLSYRGPGGGECMAGANNCVMEETDTIFNTAFRWDSYRGPLLNGVQDFHRVALHEFGHTLGLDHPDQASPPQTQPAIMDSRISSIDSLQQDDIAGVQSMYNTGPAYQSGNNAPVLLNISTRALIGTGDNVLIGGFIVTGSQPATLILRGLGGSLREAGLTNVLDDPTITLHDSNSNVIAMSDDWFTDGNGPTIASYHLDPPNSIESAVYTTLNPGAYTAVVQSFSNATEPATTGIGLVEVYDLHTTSAKLANLSTRGQVQTGDNILIGGFIIGGNSTKTIALRGLGPTLTDRGVANALADPTLELRDGSGNLLASNDNWQEDANAAAVQSEGLAPAHPSESALQATIGAGNYTGLVRGVSNSTGVALIEIYDLSP